MLDELVPDGPVVLVGHSMGGMAIMAFAERHPELFAERVAGVALVSTSAGGLKTHRIISRLIPDSVGWQIGPRLMAGLALAPELVDRVRRRGSNIGFLVADQFAFGGDVPASYVEFVDNMLAATSFEVLAQFFPNFDTLDKFAALEEFARVPTYVISGTKDVLTSIEHSRKMASRIPELDPGRVPRRRPHGDPRAEGPGQRRPRGAVAPAAEGRAGRGLVTAPRRRDRRGHAALAVRLAALLRAGDLLILSGDLGAGKTTFTQGLGDGLKVRGSVTSPTFVISRVHPSLVGGPALVHVDAYRLHGGLELDDLDLDTSLEDAVTVVEWGTGVAEGLAEDRLEIELLRAHGDTDETRTIRLTALGPGGTGSTSPARNLVCVLLAFDTATPAVTVALHDGDDPRCEQLGLAARVDHRVPGDDALTVVQGHGHCRRGGVEGKQHADEVTRRGGRPRPSGDRARSAGSCASRRRCRRGRAAARSRDGPRPVPPRHRSPTPRR